MRGRGEKRKVMGKRKKEKKKKKKDKQLPTVVLANQRAFVAC
jgi:hypothetical protein